jgi:holin-like protein
MTLLLGFQWLGEGAARVLDAPIPGPVLGLAALLGLLLVRRREPEDDLKRTSRGLLAHLSLLFVPAGVGVVVHLEALARAALPVAAAVLVGTLVAVAVTGLVARALARSDS